MELHFSQDQPAAVLLRTRQQAMSHDDAAEVGHRNPFAVTDGSCTQNNTDVIPKPVSQMCDGTRGPAWKSLQFHTGTAQCLEVANIGDSSSGSSAQNQQFADAEEQQLKTNQEEQDESKVVESIGLKDECHSSDEDVS